MADQLSPESCVSMLNEIASDAVRLITLSGQAFDYGDEADKLDAYLAAIESTARKMGWLSEVVAKALGERVPLMGTDAEAWFLPAHCKAKEKEGGS